MTNAGIKLKDVRTVERVNYSFFLNAWIVRVNGEIIPPATDEEVAALEAAAATNVK